MRRVFTLKKGKLILLVGLMVVVSVGCGYRKNSSAVTNRPGSALTQNNSEEIDEPKEEPVDTSLYVVQNLDMTSETIAVYSVDTKKEKCFSYNMTTRFLDKFGNSTSWSNFTKGTVVTIGELLPSSKAISEVRLSGDVWTLENVTDFSIDKERNVFTANGKNYKLSESTKLYSDNESIRISEITANDSLKIVGIEKSVLSICVTTGHGYIHVTNTELFNNSLIFVGNKIVTLLYGETTFEVPEGEYKITVANDGWGGSGQYEVVKNETTEVNLDEIKGDGPKYCELSFLVTVPDTFVYLDGKLIDTDEVTEVRYGSHKLAVTCSGYESWNKNLIVNSSSATITLAMEEEKSATEEKNDASSSDESTTNNNSSSTTNSTQKSPTDKNDYDYEVDYLSTVSDIIGSLMGN